MFPPIVVFVAISYSIIQHMHQFYNRENTQILPIFGKTALFPLQKYIRAPRKFHFLQKEGSYEPSFHG